MSFHAVGPDGRCLGCVAKLSLVHPFLQDWFWETVAPHFKDAHVSWGFRSEADQNACVAAGSSRLAWPESAHNKTPARAIDLFQIQPGAGENGPIAIYSVSFFFELSQMISQAGTPLLWGGQWKELGDKDHFEMTHD